MKQVVNLSWLLVLPFLSLDPALWRLTLVPCACNASSFHVEHLLLPMSLLKSGHQSLNKQLYTGLFAKSRPTVLVTPRSFAGRVHNGHSSKPSDLHAYLWEE